MKNHMGFIALILVSLCMFAWSGWVYAETTIADAYKKPANARVWTVDDAKGGHMDVGDTFTIELVTEGTEEKIKLRPGNRLNNRWKGEGASSVQVIDLTDVGASEPTLCGFAEVNTADHMDVDGAKKFGHGKWHGFLIKIKNANELKIIWSAVPLNESVNPNFPNENARNKKLKKKEKCDKLEEKFHGGMAHANG